MPQLKNTDLMNNLLTTLIKISGRKTDTGNAIYKMDFVLKQLSNKYDFLKHVQVKDTRFSEDENVVSVMSDLDNTNSNDLGKAIYAIIKNLNHSLGKQAGHFFIKEIMTSLDDDHTTTMMDMGVDLSLMKLESEVESWEKRTFRKQ